LDGQRREITSRPIKDIYIPGWTLNSEEMTIQLTKERYKTCLLVARKIR
jgi:hypothetical protein